MIDIESVVSPLVKNQFPEFYINEGPRFVDFVQQYYVWLESQNQALNRSRSLFNYRDIDKTSAEFITHFKKKYLEGVPLTTEANTQLFTKHAVDLYGTKGTDVGIQVTMQALFNEPAEVYYPSTDLFKSSHGTWVLPVYLELSISPRTAGFLGKQVIGNESGATAFVESLVKKRVAGKYIQVAYLSSVVGDFQTGEYITGVDDQTYDNAPSVIGSMTDLTVVSGGANFAVGDIFDVTSSNGKQGKARITEVNNETGKVNFIFIDALTSGGWGYSLAHANVLVASKMLQVANVTNTNTNITTFSQFETVTQQLANLAYSTARPNNASYTVGAVIENYYGNGAVSANATIVATGATNATTGYIVIAPNFGNVAASDTVFSIKGTGTEATFNANSGVANATEFITTTSPHSFVNGDIVVYSVRTGNTALTALSVGAAYYVKAANSTALQLSDTANGTAIDLTASLNETGHRLKKSLGSGVITAYSDRTSSAKLIKANTEYVGIVNVTSNAFITTPYANIVGTTSNTTATIANSSTGTGAAFNIGLLTDTETVLLSPDFLSSNNTANVQFYTVNLNGNNSGAALQHGSPHVLSTGDSCYGGLGFAKYPNSSLDSILLDCLRFDSTTIGSIASITGLNTGSDYNVDPFVVVVDEYVYGYGKHDYNMQLTPITGTFVVGEQVHQTYSNAAIQLTVNNFTGTAANGTTTTTVTTSEKVYQSYANGDTRAYGFVVEAGISAGSGTIKLRDVVGTFVVTANTTTQIKTLTTGATANASSVNATTLTTTARAIVRAVPNSSFLQLKRINLENTFINGSTVIGQASGATATVLDVDFDLTTPVIGVNANIVANVQTANNVAKTLSVYDSGFGYNDQETVTLTKDGSSYSISAIALLGKQGHSAGFYSSTRGFLDSDKKLHDNNYYQEYSYEVITKIPFDRYIDVLKKVMHVAGTKAFGRLTSTSKANTQMTVINNITVS